MLRKIPLVLLAVLAGMRCNTPQSGNEKLVDNDNVIHRDPFHQLCQYWEVADADDPTFRDLFDNHTDGVINYPGLVFMEDSTFLENPKAELRYGTFSYQGLNIPAVFDDGTKTNYTIMLKEPDKMTVLRSEAAKKTTLYLKASNVFFKPGENPYARAYTKWMYKPNSAESETELRERLKNCVTFFQFFIKGHADSKSGEVDFTGIPSCFRWYQGGIFVQNKKSLDKKWIDCFYSRDQAFEARNMVQKVLMKKYDWDTTQKNWIAQLVPVLGQIKENF